MRIRGPVEEVRHFDSRNEQCMSVLAESTTPAAELTDRAEPCDLGVELVVQRAKLAPGPRPLTEVVEIGYVVFAYHFRFAAREV